MASSAPIDIGQFIYSRPDFRNGRRCIAGTGMSVRAVASRYLRGETADEIADDLDDIPRSHIYAALVCYFANREATDADLAEYERLVAESRREHENSAPETELSATPRQATR